jgi:membrane protein YdbS with pleckstrin-like domain
VGWWAGVALVWVAVVAVAAPQVQRRWMYGIGGEDITVRHGVVTHRVARLAIRKTQAVTIHRGLFHRRYGLATVRIHTAARDVSIPHISVSDAMAIRDRLLFHVESRTQAWM